MRSFITFFVTMTVAFTAISAMAKNTADPTGTWKIQIELPNGQTYYPEATIKKKGNGLEGSYYSKNQDQTFPLEDVRVESVESGNQLHFTFKQQSILLKYVGIMDGNQLSGTADVDFRGQQGKLEFSATREANDGGLAGTWNSETEREGNTATTGTMTLSVGEDGEISGTIGNASKEIEDAKLVDGVLTFSTKGQYQGYDFVANYRGQLEGDEIKGELIIHAASAGQTREFTWKAKKVN